MTELEFRARERHPYFYIGSAFGLIFVATGLAAIVGAPRAVANDVIGLGMLAFGAAVLISAAYAARGHLRVVTDDGWCTVTWSLGRWSRSNRFPLADVRSVKRYKSPPFAVMWPSIAGTQLRVDVERVRRPIDIGGGFALDNESLTSIETVLGRP